MVSVIRLLAVVFVGMGVAMLVDQRLLKRIIDLCKKGNALYFFASARILLGVLFLLGARQCRIGFIIFVLGLLMVISGASVFYLGGAKIRAFLNRIEHQPPRVRRLIGLVPIVAGTLILYSL